MDIKAFVIHVRGQKEREEHINRELKKIGVDYEFILDGNKGDITTEHINKYFKAPYNIISAGMSCTIKHIFACEKIIEQKLKYALIFEDDIFLKPNFNEVVAGVMNEVAEKNISNFLISLENSNHAYVNKNETTEGRFLYKKDSGRCTGAYLVDSEFATSFMNNINNKKCHCIIDWYHNHLSDNNQINIYWLHPHIAEQGSHNGAMGSLIDNKKVGWFRKMVYFFQREIKSRKVK